MTFRSFTRLTLSDLAANRVRSVISMAGIALGVCVLSIVIGLGLGVRDVLLREVVTELPLDMVKVIPRGLHLGPLEIGALLGGGELTDETVARLASLPNVERAYPRLDVRIPMGARGGAGLFGRALYTDLFMDGLSADLLKEDLRKGVVPRDETIPVVISNHLLEIYNSSVAPSLGLPRLTGEALRGFEFDLVLGQSMMLGRGHARKMGVERARIVGVSPYAIRLGVSVPLETARRLLETYGGQERSTAAYSSVMLKVSAPHHVPAVVEAVREAGLDIDQTAKRTSDLLTLAMALSSLLGLLVLVLAATNIAHSFFSSLGERRRELAVLRAVGAKRRDLLGMVLFQAALLGLGGGVVGLAGAHLSAELLDWVAATLIPAFPFKPASFFAFPFWLDATVLLAAMVCGVVGATWPAVRAAQIGVARALSEI